MGKALQIIGFELHLNFFIQFVLSLWKIEKWALRCSQHSNNLNIETT